MTARHRTIRSGCLTVALLLLAVSRAPAQISPDPYSPWNAMYRPFVFPNTYHNPAIPNQARLPYLAEGGNRFGTYFESIIGQDPNLFDTTPRLGGRGVPYYPTHRNRRAAAAAAAASFGDRTFVANPDDTFYEDQLARQQRMIEARSSRNPLERVRAMQEQQQFFRAMQERDPRRRSRMLSILEARQRESSPAAGPESAPATPESLPGSDMPGSEAAPAPATPSARTGPRVPARSSARYNLLRPLSPVSVPPAGGPRERDDVRDVPPFPATAPGGRAPVPSEIENLLEAPGSPVGDLLPGLPPAPEPR